MKWITSGGDQKNQKQEREGWLSRVPRIEEERVLSPKGIELQVLRLVL